MAVRTRPGVVVLLAAVSLAPARATPDDARPSIPMPLVVTDGRGQLLRNLSPTDIEVIEDGEKRRVSSVQFRGASPRVFGLVLDDYHIADGEAAARARDAALAFVDQHVRTGDTLYLLQPLDPLTDIRPSASLEAVRARITAFTGRKGNYAPRGAFEAEYMSSAAPMAERQRAQVVRAALEALAIRMREPVDVPKALIFVSEGFSADERSRLRTTTLKAIARAAALANVTIYIIDPAADATANSPFSEPWATLTLQTGGALMRDGTGLATSFARVSSDLDGQYLVRFESAGKIDGAFHGVQVQVKRKGASVHAPSGYWAPFPAFTPPPGSTPRVNYAALLTPHVSGLIQPWFRMSPGAGGNTKVTFMWTPRVAARGAAFVQFAAITFEGARLHEAAVQVSAPVPPDDTTQTSFEVAPGPLQISMAVATASGRLLGTDVRYIEVPRLDATRPVIASVDFIRPRSLPEFTTLRQNANAVPTDVRDFMRQDRLLIRVRAFAGSVPARVTVRLVSRGGQVMAELKELDRIDNAAQFDLPFATYARGEYRLEIRASGPGESASQLIPFRLIG